MVKERLLRDGSQHALGMLSRHAGACGHICGHTNDGVGEGTAMGSQEMAQRMRQIIQGSLTGWPRIALLSIVVLAGLGMSVGSLFGAGAPQASAASNAIQVEN